MCEIARRLNGACLEMLSLSGNRIKASGTRALAQTLSSASSRIQFLDLSRNRITADGAAALASMLVQNCVLTELDVNANPITDVGLERVSRGVFRIAAPGVTLSIGTRSVKLSRRTAP